MNTTLLLYLFTRLDAMHSAFGTLLVISAVLSVFIGFILLLSIADKSNESSPSLFRSGKRMLVSAISAFFVSVVVHTLLPTSKDLAIIVGGTVLISAATSPAAQEMSDDLMKMVRLKLKEAVADVEESTNKRKK